MSDEGKPSLHDCKQAEDALKEWKQLHGQRSKLDLFSFSELDALRQDLPPDLKEPPNCFNCANSAITRLSPFTVTCSKYGISAGSSRVYVCGDWVDSRDDLKRPKECRLKEVEAPTKHWLIPTSSKIQLLDGDADDVPIGFVKKMQLKADVKQTLLIVTWTIKKSDAHDARNYRGEATCWGWTADGILQIRVVRI